MRCRGLHYKQVSLAPAFQVSMKIYYPSFFVFTLDTQLWSNVTEEVLSSLLPSAGCVVHYLVLWAQESPYYTNAVYYSCKPGIWA